MTSAEKTEACTAGPEGPLKPGWMARWGAPQSQVHREGLSDKGERSSLERAKASSDQDTVGFKTQRWPIQAAERSRNIKGPHSDYS